MPVSREQGRRSPTTTRDLRERRDVCEDPQMQRTLVTFHAHPDDESIATGGVIANAAGEGHRVVLVVATRGEVGEVAEGFLAPGEDLGARRTEETLRAAEILGAHRVEFLGYRDSGTSGTATNDHPMAFCSADLEEAAARLAVILAEERADVLTVYDSHGGYGHPDHIGVHRVGHRAAMIAETPEVFESTMNRDHIRGMVERLMDAYPESAERPDVDMEDFGTPDSQITTAIDVREFTDVKRSAMAAHASQIGESSLFLQMPPEAFREAFGWEWFIRRDATPGTRGSSLFEYLQ